MVHAKIFTEHVGRFTDRTDNVINFNFFVAGDILHAVVCIVHGRADQFGKDVELNRAHRGDLIALRSAGAYGEVMASQYNCRKLPTAHYSDTM